MAVAVLLSLCAAISYGLSDFLGGVLSRRASVWAVAATSQAAATLLVVGLVATNIVAPDSASICWGMLAGLGSGAGNVFIYRALAGGRMAVAAPLSAVTAALLPVLVGLASGERPGLRPVIGVLLAMPAIWLVSSSGSDARSSSRTDAVNGLLAGLGFGVQFSALGQIPAHAGFVPLAVSQVVSVVAIVTGAVVVSAPWLPRDRFSRLGAVAGLLAGLATICFQLAAQSGLLTIAGVLTSLYPVATVLMAALVLRERIRGPQGLGLAVAATAVALIASG